MMIKTKDMNTECSLPTSFRVIGFGIDSIPTTAAIKKLGYDGVTVQMYQNENEIFPEDENVMLVLLVTGDAENAANCAKTFYQAGVFTIAFCSEGIVLPDDCLDSQSVIPCNKFYESVETILKPIIYSGQISLDFSDISRALKDSSRFVVSTVPSNGDSRVSAAVAMLKEYYLKASLLVKIENVILILYYNKNSFHPLDIKEVSVLSDYFLTLPENISVIWGLYPDDTLCDDTIHISVICSGKELQV